MQTGCPIGEQFEARYPVEIVGWCITYTGEIVCIVRWQAREGHMPDFSEMRLCDVMRACPLLFQSFLELERAQYDL